MLFRSVRQTVGVPSPNNRIRHLFTILFNCGEKYLGGFPVSNTMAKLGQQAVVIIKKLTNDYSEVILEAAIAESIREYLTDEDDLSKDKEDQFMQYLEKRDFENATQVIQDRDKENPETDLESRVQELCERVTDGNCNPQNRKQAINEVRRRK